jgi:hypothetical protein
MDSDLLSQPVETYQSAEHQVSARARTLGLVSLVCGLTGLLVLGIPMGLIALGCGLTALSLGERNVKMGLLLGLADIVISLCIAHFFPGFSLF